MEASPFNPPVSLWREQVPPLINIIMADLASKFILKQKEKSSASVYKHLCDIPLSKDDVAQIMGDLKHYDNGNSVYRVEDSDGNFVAQVNVPKEIQSSKGRLAIRCEYAGKASSGDKSSGGKWYTSYGQPRYTVALEPAEPKLLADMDEDEMEIIEKANEAYFEAPTGSYVDLIDGKIVVRLESEFGTAYEAPKKATAKAK